jgi:heme-degrading monooxygenase HmoA
MKNVERPYRKEINIMSESATTPTLPYYAVIFTSHRTEGDNGYGEMAARMAELAARQPGFLGMESARDNVGITVSYWADLASIKAWKAHAEHLIAQERGREIWYSEYKIRIARVEEDYGWDSLIQRPPVNIVSPADAAPSSASSGPPAADR